MSEETKVELGLKEVLAECLEALHERLHDGEQQARDLQQQITGCRGNDEKPPSPGLKPDLDAVDVENSRTRAALAVVERWAAVEVVAREHGGVVDPQILAEARTPGFYGVSLLSVWKTESQSRAEVEAIAHLAAALECRRRNGEV